jgi:hypothetical protein
MLDLFEKTHNSSALEIYLTNAVYMQNDFWYFCISYHTSHCTTSLLFMHQQQNSVFEMEPTWQSVMFSTVYSRNG